MRKLTHFVLFLFVILMSYVIWPAGWAKAADWDWAAQAWELYVSQNRSSTDQARLLELLETHLGIGVDGRLNLDLAQKAAAELTQLQKTPRAESETVRQLTEQFSDRLSLEGYNYLYFETCARDNGAYGERFVRYFQKGFYPNRTLSSKSTYYYKILLFYLIIVRDQVVDKLGSVTDQLNKDPKATPVFSDEDVAKLETAVAVSIELDGLRSQGAVSEISLYKEAFTDKQRVWLDQTIDYFSGPETHANLATYKWLKNRIPARISAEVISHQIWKLWKQDAIAQRNRPPVVLFSEQLPDQASDSSSAAGKIARSIELLGIGNKEVDRVVMYVLKTWLVRLSKYSPSTTDRTTYTEMLRDLELSSSGSVFADLYAIREPLAKIKEHAQKWETLDDYRKKSLFEKEVEPLYIQGLDAIDRAFEEMGGRRSDGLRAGVINYIFYKNRGELVYNIEKMRLATYADDPAQTRAAVANLRKDCLEDLKSAFLRASQIKENHVNLLNAYNLLFQGLVKLSDISQVGLYLKEMEELVSGKHALGSVVDQKDDIRYDTYRLIAYAYLSHEEFEQRSLDVARRGLELAKINYIALAKTSGYMVEDNVGAVPWAATEKHDYERQYELYRDVARRLGKKVNVLLPEADIDLYNRIQSVKEH